MLEGLLVDLVPRGDDFKPYDYLWLNNESEMWRTGGLRRIESRTRAARVRRRQRNAMRRDPSVGVMFGIVTKPTAPEPGLPIGFVRTREIHPVHRWAQISIQIGNLDYWGGGYGTDAVTLFIDYCFTWFDLRRVWLSTSGKNARVQRQMEKLGFTLEGRRRRAVLFDGEWVDWLNYGLLRAEWPGRAALVARLGMREMDVQAHKEAQAE